MKDSTKNQAEGTLHKVSGQIKELLGKIGDDHKLKNEGKAEKIKGKIQQKIGQVEKVIGK